MNSKIVSVTGERLLQEWYSVFAPQSFALALQEILSFIPKLFVSALVFLVGWLIASGVGKLVSGLLKSMGFNRFFGKSGWQKALERAEIEVDVSHFLGAVIKWVLVFVFLAMAVEILGLNQFAGFLSRVLAFIPNVIVAVLIFVSAVVISDILEKIVIASLEKANLGYTKLAGLLVRWSVLSFSLLAILVQLGIAKELVLILFQGVVGFFVIAFGLAFGLGGQDIAREVLERIKREIE